MYEQRSQPLLPRRRFLLRLLAHALVAVSLVMLALLIGIVGYSLTERMAFVDALLNASMILGGMGPVHELHTLAGKLFASFYALFSGALFLVIVGILIAPVAHRLLHWLHLEAGEESPSELD